MSTTLQDIQSDLLSLYEKEIDSIQSGLSKEINAHRQPAYEEFKTKGLPTKKVEAYKYTNLEKYLSGEYEYELAPSSYKVDLRDLFRCDIPELNTYIVLMLNGFYYSTENFDNNTPKNVIICSLAEATQKYPELVEAHYGKYAESKHDSLVSLNTMFAQDGVFIHIPDGVVLDKPIQIINMGYSTQNLRVNRRNLFVVGKNAQADILICDHTLCQKSFITNSLTEVFAGENSNVDVVRLQNENSHSSQMSSLFVHQDANSVFSSCTLSLHGGLIRNSVYAKLNGENCENNTNALFLVDNKQHMSFFTDIQHAKPHCLSNQLVKGILKDDATGAFNGKIYVDEYAIKTQAYQTNNNILLSENAKMNSKPQLEIYNDDVKCSHGATVGQLDTEALFYIRSRGIGDAEAKHLLMYAFANDVIRNIKLEPLRDRIINMVDKRLRGKLTACENCNIKH